MIIVLNDCTGKIQLWSQKLKPYQVATFNHPNNMLRALIDSPEDFQTTTTCIFDRKYHGDDMIYSDVMQEIVKIISTINPKIKIVVSSGLYPRKAVGFKYNIPPKPVSFDELNAMLETIDEK